MDRSPFDHNYALYGGIRLFDTEHIGDAYEDWSGVRSLGRARRRRLRGFPQRIVTRYRPNGKCIHDKIHNVIYIHPIDRLRLEAAIRQQDRGNG